jgi:tRNA 2-thiouridine synthesizing protein A
MPEITIDQTLDASGLSCPMPLLKTKQALHKLDEGKVLKVIATDAGSVRDVITFVEHSDHTLLESFTEKEPYQYIIRKGAKT